MSWDLSLKIILGKTAQKQPFDMIKGFLHILQRPQNHPSPVANIWNI